MTLSAEGARVIGSLVEKDLTTPDQYPLTIKSLLAACNQASNRDPVVTYDEHTVMSTLNALKEQKVVRFVLPSHGRSAIRYRHVLPEAWALDQRQCALVAVLLLRGPQTVGELRSRTDRMTSFENLDEVEHELQFLSTVEEPLAVSLGRKPGQKEERWICPLVITFPITHGPGGAIPLADYSGYSTPSSHSVQTEDAPHEGSSFAAPNDRYEDLRSELDELRSEIAGLRRNMEELRDSLGG